MPKMSTNYFNRLRDLVDNQKIEFQLIIAPPRSNSTLIEHCLGESPDTSLEIHEPFVGARLDDYDPEIAYKFIYDSITKSRLLRSKKKKTVVIKDMSHWIGKNDEFARLFSLTSRPILFLIRNPLLCVESRIRKVVESIDKKCRQHTVHWMLNRIAEESHLQNWHRLVSVAETRTYSTRHLAFVSDYTNLRKLYDKPNESNQAEILDYRAQMVGYVNWRDLVSQKLYIERDYSYFGRLLETRTRQKALEEIEFTTILDQVQYCKKKAKQFIILDTSDVRSKPSVFLRRLCEELGMRFSKTMIDWGSRNIDFATLQVESSERIWYDNIYSSSRVQPPKDICPPSQFFPGFVRDYILDKHLPVYAKLCMQKLIPPDCERSSLNEEDFVIVTSHANIPKFRRHSEMFNFTIGEVNQLKMSEIDPLYALTNDPELYEKLSFRNRNKEYSREIEVMSSNNVS